MQRLKIRVVKGVEQLEVSPLRDQFIFLKLSCFFCHHPSVPQWPRKGTSSVAHVHLRIHSDFSRRQRLHQIKKTNSRLDFVNVNLETKLQNLSIQIFDDHRLEKQILMIFRNKKFLAEKRIQKFCSGFFFHPWLTFEPIDSNNFKKCNVTNLEKTSDWLML